MASGASMLLLVGLSAGCVWPELRPPASAPAAAAAAVQPRPAITSGPVTTSERESSTAERPALGSYLQAVAGALAAPAATADSVLRAAHARNVRRVDLFAEFGTPDPRVTNASIRLAEAGDPDPHPRSVEFRFNPNGAAVTLSELAQAFGAWRGDLAGTSAADPHQVEFARAYPPELEAARPRGPLTFVRVSLSGDPRTEGVRVRRVLLTRFSVGP